MMMRFVLALVLCVAPLFEANAQGGMMPGPGTPHTTSVTFSSLGDIQSGWTSFYSCGQAYSLAYATSNGKMCNLVRASDSHTCDILAASGGGPGLTANCSTGGDNGQTLFAWDTVVTTASCSAAGTTLTCTGATATPASSTVISGANIAQPEYLISGCSFTGGAGTCNTAGTLSFAAETVTFYTILNVTAAYDQTGNSHDISQSTGASQPYLLAAGSGLPPMGAINGNRWLATTSGVSAVNQPYTMSFVGSGDPTAIEQYGLAMYGGTGAGILSFNEAGTVGNDRLYCGSDLNVTAASSVVHALNGVCNGASSSLNIDGSVSSGTTSTTATPANSIGLGAQNNGTEQLKGSILEAAFLPASTTLGPVCHNQWIRWSSIIGGSPPC